MPDTSGAATLGKKKNTGPLQEVGPGLLLVEVNDGADEAENHFFSAPLREQFERIQAKTTANQGLEEELGKYGYAITPDTYFALMLNAMADVMFPDTELGQRMRFAWMELVQDRMAEGLTKARDAMARTLLSHGAAVPPAWIDAINRQAKAVQAGHMPPPGDRK